jgi:two-component system sensor histidine kinase/response regulator
MLTSGGQAGEVARCRELGVGSYLMKPIKQSELLRAIGSALHLTWQSDPKASAAAPRDARPLRILLAEDNVVNQRLAVRLLEKAGHSAVVADNGKRALAALEREPFDLILMDVEMPEMGGFEATAAVREREKTTGRHVPIIAMTAHALKGDRDRCLAAGMDGYVSKPIQFHELCRIIDGTVPRGDTSGLPNGADAAQDVLDRQTVLQCVGGDWDLLREIIEVFASHAPLWMADIRDAIAREDAARLRLAAHTLKGALGHFGVGTVYNQAEQLETMGHNRNLTGAAQAWERLDQQVERLLRGLAQFQ